MAMAAEAENLFLSHQSLNPDGPETILLIHGAFASSSEWDLVSSILLSKYHLLIPDLPAHGKSVNIQPFDVSTASRMIADLIRAQAHGSKAHVVGFSLGSIVAADLASHHEGVVRTLLVSGFIRLPPSPTTILLPYFFGLERAVTSMVPRSVTRYFLDGTDLQQSAPWSSKLSREVCQAIVSDKPLEPIQARALVIAATKGGLIPSNDRVEDARKLGKAAQSGNADSRVVEHPRMRHPWIRQNPTLFAETVGAWIEGLKLPAGFKLL